MNYHIFFEFDAVLTESVLNEIVYYYNLIIFAPTILKKVK
jgi:hypothetical protein